MDIVIISKGTRKSNFPPRNLHLDLKFDYFILLLYVYVKWEKKKIVFKESNDDFTRNV